jgi:hypothetical protein
MKVVFFFAAVMFVVIIPLLAVLFRRQSLATSNPADHNHMAMARWIERQLRDDLVRVSIPPDQQGLAESLLVEFYGDDDHKLRELP